MGISDKKKNYLVEPNDVKIRSSNLDMQNLLLGPV